MWEISRLLYLRGSLSIMSDEQERDYSPDPQKWSHRERDAGGGEVLRASVRFVKT